MFKLSTLDWTTVVFWLKMAGMHQSELFTQIRREAPSDEMATNAELLIRAGFVHKELAGVYSYLPLGYRVLMKIANLVREEITHSLGAQEVLMSSLHPLENYQKTGRDKIDVLFHTELSSGGELVLGQSHEEIVVPLVKGFLTSYRDLPLGVFQIQTKFRNEKRAKSGLMRGREFLMKDLYSFHQNEADFDSYYDKVRAAYTRIFEAVGLGDTTYFTYASGGTFSDYSHEFQTLTEAGEDNILVCEKCHLAVNEEFTEKQTTCPGCEAPFANLEKRRALEVANIFPLKTKFSSAFSLTYRDEQGEEKLAIMGCYGLGISRLLGAIAEIHSDDKGLIWPEKVAPFKVHLLTFGEAKDPNVLERAEKLYDKLTTDGHEVLWDDREVSAGEKMAGADLIGLPYRIVISPKTLAESKVELKLRRESDVKLIPEDKLCNYLG